MWISDQWQDFELIDCSEGEKLERWGDFFLIRLYQGRHRLWMEIIRKALLINLPLMRKLGYNPGRFYKLFRPHSESPRDYGILYHLF